VILSDYGKGVISDSISRHVIETCNKLGKITIVDPKGADWNKYSGATIITPNVKELAEVAKTKVRNNDDDITAIGQRVRDKYNLKYLVVTRSDKGISVLAQDSVVHTPTQAKEVFDVSGAGDTVVATMACALSAKASIEEAVSIANIAAGVVVSKAGTAPITLDELTRAIYGKESDYNVPLEPLLALLAEHRKNGKKIIFTNGCFDILHRGHVDYLRKAKALGDILVVGLNSDASVKRLKGDTRPINKEDDRAFVLSGLNSVDYVVIFDENTPKELLSKVKPNILVKGGDYTPETVIGKEYAEKVVIIDFVDGYSTTATIERIG
jgi:D-beta-D-heptose 7-phosphate kinase/D-beta-D-heptose 1-phosphate adenosyltransferase